MRSLDVTRSGTPQSSFQIQMETASSMFQHIDIWIATACTLIAAITDLKSRRIPNWLTLGCFVAALSFHIWQIPVSGFWSLTSALEGGVLAFVILFVLWRINGAGAGDVKLAGAVGVWIETKEILYVLLISFVLCLIWRMVIEKRWQNTERETPPFRIPFAVPMALVMVGLLAWRSFG